MRGEFPAMRFSPARLPFSWPRYWAKIADNFPNTTDRAKLERPADPHPLAPLRYVRVSL